MDKKIGFIGLGAMGKPMATNIVRAGFNLTVYDIRPEPMQELEKLGANTYFPTFLKAMIGIYIT